MTDRDGTQGVLPLLVYDGDCGFCKYWAMYWQKLTGGRVAYEPYQQAATRYPSIPVAEFQRAVQYIAPDGSVARAAEASFLALSHAPGRGFWLWLYRLIPGFAAVSEGVYAFIAAHRPAFCRLSLMLWGREHEPARYDRVTGLFLRMLGLIYLSAFVSFGMQAMGLIGSSGILPLAQYAGFLKSHTGVGRYWVMPMVFWLDSSDAAIEAVCWGGAALSLLLVAGVWQRFCLFFLYILYLSLIYAGQAFMHFQWDIFLVETGFLAWLMSIWQTPGMWLLRWLLFRFMFLSGAIKLQSGDPNWAHLTALSYHFLTQPLPTPLAWYAAQMPARVKVFLTVLTFFIELVLPFFIFCPRRLRFVAAFGMLGLEFCIFLTGNYNWFNLQTMLLCLLLFDDAALQKLFRGRALPPVTPQEKPGKIACASVLALALLVVFCSVSQMEARFGHWPSALARAVNRAIRPWHIVNSYGLFAVMTTKREEIVIEGSDDGKQWKEYGFKYKPGDVTRPPLLNIPGQPRLDWQMWFAALENPQQLGWFHLFLNRILQNSPPVMALLERNPFPDKPPHYVRAQFYDYTYASPADKEKGIWWNRKLIGSYFPIASLPQK